MIKVGTYVGTAAAINISLGWNPDALIVMNKTDGDTLEFYTKDMADGTAIEVILAAATLAANGVTPYAGDATHAPGFTVGTTLSENGDTYLYIAMRQGIGSGGQ